MQCYWCQLYLYTGSVDVIVTGCSPKIGGVEAACVFNVTNHLHLVEEPGTGLYQSFHIQLQSRVSLVKMKVKIKVKVKLKINICGDLLQYVYIYTLVYSTRIEIYM